MGQHAKYRYGQTIGSGYHAATLVILATVIALLLPVAGSEHSGEPHLDSTAVSKPAATTMQAVPEAPAASASMPVYHTVTTTIFWVGEPADGDNGYIANAASAWDGRWQQHYGGVDDPTNRNGYLPSFTPKENPFYVALPYTDIANDGTRKASANSCPLYTSLETQAYSWCKNSWLAIRHGDKTVYAQWEDTGPFEDDDATYVFGAAHPRNQRGAKAGLDVSPAVRDYLGLNDVDTCSWAFVSPLEVPDGAWKTVVTTNLGDPLN